MQDDRNSKWFNGSAARWLITLVTLAVIALPFSATGQEPAEDDAWIADLGKVKALNEVEPQLVKAQFHDSDGILMDIEKLYVSWEYVNKKTGTWLALSAIDTYMKCKVEYIADKGLFRDPCYGSEYDLAGHVTKGPAKKNLPDYTDLLFEEDGYLKLKRYPEK